MADDADAPGATEDDLLLSFQWRLECAMVWTRWLAVPLFVVPLIVVPHVLAGLIASLAVALALMNFWLYQALRRPNSKSLRQARRWGPILEWAVTLGILVACAPDPTSAVPAVMLILVGIAGRREGASGVLRATVAAKISIALLIAIQVLVLQVLRPEQALVMLVLWQTVFLAGGLVLWRLQRIHEAWWRQQIGRWEEEHLALQRLIEEQRRWQVEHVALQRFESRLSPREWEVLSLLAQGNLTYAQIADQLSVDVETVRTHLRHLGLKLGVSGGGRQAILLAARQHELLPEIRGDSSGNPPANVAEGHDESPPRPV